MLKAQDKFKSANPLMGLRLINFSVFYVHAGHAVSVDLNLRDSGGTVTQRLQGAIDDGRLKTTTSRVRHRLHAWEENRKRRGVAGICIGDSHWAGTLEH